MKHRLILLVAMFLALPFVADAQTYHFTAVAPTGQTLYYYRVNDHEVYVARQNTSWPYYDTPPSGALTIPATVWDGSTAYDVTGVAAYAFSQCSTLTAVNLPTSIRVIGSNAFNQCYGFTSISIPNGVTTIEVNAFYDCYQATSLTIPSTVTSIGNYAFGQCIGLTSVTVPNSVTTIGNGAFANCRGLTSITLPNGLTTIADYTFDNCDQLSSITIPSTVTYIGAYAFSHCSSITSLTIPNSVTTILQGAFQYTGLTSINIPNSVTTIENSAFRYCTSLTSTTLSNALTSIADNTFQGCTSLSSVTIPNSVTTIGTNAFTNCSSLTSINIPNSVTTIGPYAFYRCSNLTTVTLSNSLTTIDYHAFYACTSLTSINIPSSVTTIGHNAFNGCRSLTSLSLPNTITSIGSLCFANCGSLTSINIPTSLSTIQNSTFWCCTSLTSITIPSSVTSIEGFAFNGCTGLRSIECQAVAPPNVENGYAFMDIPTNIPVHVPCGSLADYQGAIIWSNFTNLTDFPYNVTVSSNDDSYGTATASLNCATSTVTLTATPNCGYRFVRWANSSDETVSNDATYSFTATGDVALTAEFEVLGKVKIGQLWYTLDCDNGTATVVSEKDSGPHYYTTAPVGCLTIPSSVDYNGNTFSVTKIGSHAFRFCFGLTSVSIPNTVTTIEDCAFFDCYGLTSLIIPNSVTNIEVEAFQGCYGLTSVSIPNSVTTIGRRAFNGCNNLTSITIPSSVTSIGVSCFGFCNGLTSISVESGNTAYDSRENCNAIIETATNKLIASCMNTFIPSSITSIEDYGFYLITGLTSLVCYAEVPPTVGEGAFYIFHDNDNTRIPVYVPCGTVAAYQAAEGWSSFTNIQELASCQHTVTVNSNDESWGTVSGGGTYTIGTEISLTATPADGFVFQQWHDGITDNPRTLTVTEDVSLTAYFAPASVSSTGVSISVDGDAIVVDGANGNTVTLYDNNGNLLDSQHSAVGTPLRLESMSSGTYYVKIGAIPARMKVIVN